MPENGKKYGPYEILGALGGGGMGFVFRAWDARLHREVAIKLLNDEYSMPGMRERFLREARAASALNHPNICTVFDIGEQDGEPYLVMELLEGETLKDRIDYRTIQVDEIISIGREVAEALGAAHSKGVIHRDVKPANIFLVDRPNGGVQSKVLDFGLAKFQGGPRGARNNRSLELTAVGATVGTLAYMSPEQARGEILDSRSDLFSLGVVLYEMATRHIPFPGATSALVFVKLLNHPPEPVRTWNEAVPKELDRIILKLMAKERTARFQTAQELDAALAKVGEKASGGWLRKAVSVPLVRIPDPVARDRRAAGRKAATESQTEMPAIGGGVTSFPPSPGPSPIPPADERQFLRPVARVPRGDNSPPPDSGPISSERPARIMSGGRPGAAAEVAAGAEANGLAAPARPQGLAATPTADPVAPVEKPQTESAEFAAAVRAPFEQSSRERRARPGRWRWSPASVLAVSVALIALGIAVYLAIQRASYHPILLTANDAVVISEVENHTGNTALDGTVAEGLELALGQSPYLLLRNGSSYRAARHQVTTTGAEPPAQMVARRTAQQLGTKAYVFGSINGTAAPYIIHLDLINTVTNETMNSVEESAPAVEQIPGAIDHVAATLRFNVGETADSISRTRTPLAREATTNLDALHDLSLGDAAFDSGRPLEALGLYQQAAKLEPKFPQAQLRLAVLYRKLRAEVASAEAARLAVAAAVDAGERTRTMAQYEFEMNASGDYVRAATLIRQRVNSSPHDSEALDALARTLRLQGRVVEALQTAQQAYADDAYDAEAYIQAENALIGLDRYEAAAQLEGQLQRLGLAHTGGILAAAYLGGRQDALSGAIAALEAPHTGFRADWNYGIYLDNTGHLNAGAALWRSMANAAAQMPGLESAAAFMLSQGAIDRALLGDCGPALTLARESDEAPQGLTAMFNSGMTHALCGGKGRAQELVAELEKTYGQSFAVKGFYAADINAALALTERDPAAALETLKGARQYDLISLTPVLRGRAHVELRQVQIGIVDFQTVLAHRGVPFIVGSVVYPVAQLGVARAFAETGDLGNSAQAYRRFLELWNTADPRHPLLLEARAHSN